MAKPLFVMALLACLAGVGGDGSRVIHWTLTSHGDGSRAYKDVQARCCKYHIGLLIFPSSIITRLLFIHV